METIVTITLVVKGDKHDDELRGQIQTIDARLMNWFLADVRNGAPYGSGSLLHYRIHVNEVPEVKSIPSQSTSS